KSAGTAFDGSNPSPSTIFSLIGKSKSQLIELAFFVSVYNISLYPLPFSFNDLDNLSSKLRNFSQQLN
ncbi:hypothetical protein AB6E16_11095, partial [Vibrio atlanticus]|uniref:hypothetical protein n=1 Tax=Vibrio TaxID=662 RepID=UPI00352E1416